MLADGMYMRDVSVIRSGPVLLAALWLSLPAEAFAFSVQDDTRVSILHTSLGIAVASAVTLVFALALLLKNRSHLKERYLQLSEKNHGLLRKQQQIERLLYFTPAVTYSTILLPDGSHEVHYISPNASELFHIPADQVLQGGVWTSRLDEAGQKQRRALLMMVTEKGYGSCDYSLPCPGGGRIWVRDSLKLVENVEGKLECSGSLLDITELKMVQIDLAQSEEEYRRIAEMLPVGVFHLNSGGYVTYMNNTLRQMMGDVSVGDIRQLMGYIYPTDRIGIAEDWAALISKDAVFERQCRLQLHRGDYVWVKIVAIREFTAAGEMAGYSGSVVNIHEMKLLEEQLTYRSVELESSKHSLERQVALEKERQKVQEQLLLQQSKMAVMGQMIGAIAHQWKQPLNSIGIIAQSLEDAYEYGELTAESLSSSVARIMEQIQYMGQTVNDFRTFFQPSTAGTHFTISGAVAGVSRLIMPQLVKSSIRLVLEDTLGPDSTVAVAGVENEFKQALMNVIVNAKDAILQYREVHLTPAYAEGGDTIRIRIDKDGDKIVVEVCDSAGGITDEVKAKLFEPYFTTKGEKGTGIGLYVVKTVIEKMSGSVDMQNREGGVCVRFELPCRTETQKM